MAATDRAASLSTCTAGAVHTWVFHAAEAVVHRASPTRGAVVVREMMDGHRPAVWISDRYTAQQGHAAQHQTCLAHLARDVAYAVEVSDDPVPWRLQLWLRSVFALAENATDLAATTLAAKRRSLDRQLGAILSAPSRCDLTRDLQAKIARARDQLLVFLSYPGTVEPTNNGSERLLRPSVVITHASDGEAQAPTVLRMPTHLGNYPHVEGARLLAHRCPTSTLTEEHQTVPQARVFKGPPA